MARKTNPRKNAIARPFVHRARIAIVETLKQSLLSGLAVTVTAARPASNFKKAPGREQCGKLSHLFEVDLRNKDRSGLNRNAGPNDWAIIVKNASPE